MDKKGFDWKSFGIGVIAGSAMSGPTSSEIETQRLNQINDENHADERRQAREENIRYREERDQQEAEAVAYRQAHPLTPKELKLKELAERAKRYEQRERVVVESHPQEIAKKPYKSLIPRWLDILGIGIALIAIFLPLPPALATGATVIIIGGIT